MAEVQVQDKGGDGKVRSKKMSTKVDMTPMVDLGFLLITFFMFTTTFSKPNVMAMKLPAKPDKTDNSPKPEIDLTNSITMILGKDDKIYYHQLDNTGLTGSDKLNVTSFDKGAIGKVIAEAKTRAKRPEIFTIIIKPSDDSNYKNLVDMLDEMAVTKNETYGIGEIKKWEKTVYEQKIGK
jgi:biopolymer transport protein ExbD